MRKSYWERVVADGYRVPHGAALDQLTTELVTMLGSPDPSVRDDTAYSILSTWTAEGVYDELLAGLGDGLALGLRNGLGEDGTESVFRRSFSAAGLATVVLRDNSIHTLHPTTVLTWADRAVDWLLGERDLRGWIPGQGRALAMAHGADLIGALTASRYLGPEELRVLLDVIAERLLTVTNHRLVDGECDRLAYATMSLLHRDQVPVEVLEQWLERLSMVWLEPVRAGTRPAPVRANCVAYARALHLQLLLGVTGTAAQNVKAMADIAPAARPDLLIALQGALRTSEPETFRQSTPAPQPR